MRIVTALVVLVASALPASAEMRPSDSFPVDLAGVVEEATKSVFELTLIGRSGQIYAPTGSGWSRRGSGGIAADVIGAVRIGKRLFAVGTRAPIYRLKGNAWLTTPLPNRGPASLSVGGSRPLASVGKHLYHVENGRWTRLASAARWVTALWSRSSKEAYVATTRGRLRRYDGKRFVPIANSLAVEDKVTTMRGSSTSELYGLSQGGELLWIQRTSAKIVDVEKAAPGLEIRHLGSGPKGQMLALGLDEERTAYLLTLNLGKISSVQRLWPVAEGDEVRVIVSDAQGRLLIGTRNGQIRVREPKSEWQEIEIKSILDLRSPKLPAGRAPALSR